MIEAVKKFELKGYIKQNSNVKELKRLVRKGIPVIVDWFSPEEGSHYSVVVGFKKDKIIIADPHFGKIREYNTDWFEDRWFDRPFKNVIIKEIIVIHK